MYAPILQHYSSYLTTLPPPILQHIPPILRHRPSHLSTCTAHLTTLPLPSHNTTGSSSQKKRTTYNHRTAVDVVRSRSRPGAKRYPVRSSQPSSKKKRTTYSHITAADVVHSIGKGELIKKFKPMLTDHRTVLLEARDLINSDCKDSIQAKLRSGQCTGAATELVEFFEANHDGDKMMDFCSFLEDQAGNTAPVLKKLAKVIRGYVEMLSGE